jgi:3,4-dihydroxy-9,10-secoandrosta-1,3,5(10)-triene-9,17-dione 4,5-dioxygenase
VSGIRSLGYLRVSATDTAAWREFGTKILGMVEGKGPNPSNVYLRMDDFPARIIVSPGDEDKLLVSGWEAGSDSDLDALRTRLEEAGVAVKDGSTEDRRDRQVQGLIQFTDPLGNSHEVFWGAALAARPFLSPYGTKFVTGEMGMGHVVLPALDDQAALDFYGNVLGFRLRDSMRMDQAFGATDDSNPMWMRFLGVNERHHSLAFGPMPLPAGIIHLMIEVDSLDGVGLAWDRCLRKGVEPAASLGKHANDHMVSFYVKTPGGFDIEYGTGGMLVDDSTWVSRQTGAISLWGHKFAAGGGHH